MEFNNPYDDPLQNDLNLIQSKLGLYDETKKIYDESNIAQKIRKRITEKEVQKRKVLESFLNKNIIKESYMKREKEREREKEKEREKENNNEMFNNKNMIILMFLLVLLCIVQYINQQQMCNDIKEMSKTIMDLKYKHNSSTD